MPPPIRRRAGFHCRLSLGSTGAEGFENIAESIEFAGRAKGLLRWFCSLVTGVFVQQARVFRQRALTEGSVPDERVAEARDG